MVAQVVMSLRTMIVAVSLRLGFGRGDHGFYSGRAWPWREEANAGSGHGGKGIGGKWPTGVRTAVSCLARGGRRCGLGPRRIGEIFKSFSWPVKIDILS